jgi:hypothetical protein
MTGTFAGGPARYGRSAKDDSVIEQTAAPVTEAMNMERLTRLFLCLGVMSDLAPDSELVPMQMRSVRNTKLLSRRIVCVVLRFSATSIDSTARCLVGNSTLECENERRTQSRQLTAIRSLPQDYQ